MPSFEVEFEVYCSCGNGLCGGSSGNNTKRGPSVTVEPCERCLDKAREEAIQKYEKGE